MPIFSISYAETMQTRAVTDPTEMSIPPVIMTMVCPRAMTRRPALDTKRLKNICGFAKPLSENTTIPAAYMTTKSAIVMIRRKPVALIFFLGIALIFFFPITGYLLPQQALPPVFLLFWWQGASGIQGSEERQ